MANVDPGTVDGFGFEWTKFDQSTLSQNELAELFNEYFELFPWAALPEHPVGFDLGCGSGRWAKLVAPRVAILHCIDASGAALNVARRNLVDQTNCVFHQASVDDIPLPDDSMDFAYSLGVLHHVPDTAVGIKSCVAKLKPGAPLLLYLYYAFDNRPLWFRMVWKASDLMRRVVSGLPERARYWTSSAIAALVYFPLARFAYLLEKLGLNVRLLPLSAYRNRSFYTMRTDALDRFGTRVEHRFTAAQIRDMMRNAGLERIEFSRSVYWCALGYKQAEG